MGITTDLDKIEMGELRDRFDVARVARDVRVNDG
jgi:hypothetical protein